MRRGAVGTLALAAAVSLAVSAAAPARAAETVGGTFPPSGGAAQCGNDRTWLQYAIPADA